MTTMAQAVEAMYQHFADGWGSTTPYQLDNEKFDKPEGSPWARVVVRHNSAAQETLGQGGNRRFSRSGSVFVQLFVPVDEGVGGTGNADSAVALATLAQGIFEGTRIAGTTVRFLDVTARETGPRDSWYQAVVEAEFQYDETK